MVSRLGIKTGASLRSSVRKLKEFTCAQVRSESLGASGSGSVKERSAQKESDLEKLQMQTSPLTHAETRERLINR